MRQVVNPPNPYNRYSAEYVGEPPPTKLEIFEETATKKVITKAFASDWEGGWRYTVNCYRGCVHGCTYCFARQYHEYLGYGAGTDFETKIVVKPIHPIAATGTKENPRQNAAYRFFFRNRPLPAARSRISTDASMPRSLCRIPRSGRCNYKEPTCHPRHRYTEKTEQEFPYSSHCRF